MNILELISLELMIPKERLDHIIRSAPYRYKVYEIDKKEGRGKRVIAQPAREVKAIQYWVMTNILSKFPVHSAAIAYRKGRSILDNAEKHKDARYLLKLDFKDFFHSITSSDLKAYLTANSMTDLSEDDIIRLQKILFWNRGRTGKLILSIGAPSSPLLSNILMYEFDKAVLAFCAKRKVKYTRYADDLTFSTKRPNVLREVELQVATICKSLKYPRLTVNEGKTVHASRKGALRVTGLVLSNDGSVSLGNARKRLIRAQVHHCLEGNMPYEDRAKLRGMLAFVYSVEPEFLDRLRMHYGDSSINKIINNSDPGKH